MTSVDVAEQLWVKDSPYVSTQSKRKSRGIELMDLGHLPLPDISPEIDEKNVA